MKINELNRILNQSMEKNDGKVPLIRSAIDMATTLQRYVGKKIEIGNNNQTPLNERIYTLKDYEVLRVLDGMYESTSYALSLVITVVDEDGGDLSFVYPYIKSISNEQSGDMKRFFVEVRDRLMEDFIAINLELAGSPDEELVREKLRALDPNIELPEPQWVWSREQLGKLAELRTATYKFTLIP